MWIFYAILAGIFYTGSNLISRYVLKGKKDAWAYSFFFSLMGALVSLPLMLVDFQATFTPKTITLSIALGFLIVLHNFLNFKANNYISPSLIGSITKLRLVWIFIIGVLFLSEIPSDFKILGTIITIISGLIVVGGIGKNNHTKGVIFVVISTILYAIGFSTNKYLLEYFNPASLTFFMIFLVPTILNLIIMPNSFKRVSDLYKAQGKYVIIGCIFGGLANLAVSFALDFGEASRVGVLVESFLVITLAGEVILLKEKKNLFIKILAVGLATIGAVLISIQ